MAKRPNRLEKRQVILGADMDGFEPAPQSPVSNFIDVGAGYFTNESDGEVYMMALQAVGPFAAVAAGSGRWDLVYLDDTGTAQIEVGTPQVLPTPAYTGAPGNGAPFTAPDVWPVAYVYVDEAAGVLVDATDITYLRSYSRNDEKGVVGELAPDAGAVGVLGTIWNRVPIDHQHPLNTDAVNPADVTAAAPAPGGSGIYADRAHVHQMDAGLLASLSASRDRGSSMFWTPRTHLPGGINTNNYHWILHQFQGRAVNDDLVWFNINVGTEEALTLWPTDSGAPNVGNIGPGGSDTTNVAQATMPDGWLYVYLIGNPVAGTAALVYSTNAPSVGPGLAHAAFVGYTAWRVVTAIELDHTAVTPAAVPACKYDNIVLKLEPTGETKTADSLNVGGHPQALYWAADMVATPISLTQHVSPLSMAVLLNIWMFAAGGGAGAQSVELRINYDNVTPTAISPFGVDNWDDHFKRIEVNAKAVGEEDLVLDSIWINLSRLRTFLVTIAGIAGGGGNAAVGMVVMGYIENTDLETATWDFTI